MKAQGQQPLVVDVHPGESVADAIFRAALREHGAVQFNMVRPARRRPRRKKRPSLGFRPPKKKSA